MNPENEPCQAYFGALMTSESSRSQAPAKIRRFKVEIETEKVIKLARS